MRPSPRRLAIAGMVVGVILALAAHGYAQAVPEGRMGTDPSQTQRDRTPIDLSTIDKPKPEIEIYTGPDVSGPPHQGVVVVPEEEAKSPAPSAPPAKGPPAPPAPKEKADY